MLDPFTLACSAPALPKKHKNPSSFMRVQIDKTRALLSETAVAVIPLQLKVQRGKENLHAAKHKLYRRVRCSLLYR